mmetsp:Transcript_4042/g.5804  ORF Transcript_4042/g.5804 Transcript_4042/m.5804 type:complete len:161 (-) Transcript_4042:264-746(-)
MDSHKLVVGSPSRDESPLRKRLANTSFPESIWNMAAESSSTPAPWGKLRKPTRAKSFQLNSDVCNREDACQKASRADCDKNYSRLKYKLYRTLNVVKNESHLRRSLPIPIPKPLVMRNSSYDQRSHTFESSIPSIRSQNKITQSERSSSYSGDTQFDLEL